MQEIPTEKNLLRDIVKRLQTSTWAMVIAIGGGFTASQLLVFLLSRINSSPQDVHLVLSLFFLMFQRPVFCCTVAIAIMPFVLRNRTLAPLTSFMSHPFWFLFARLSYGAYLSH
jgi:hypothetical protein